MAIRRQQQSRLVREKRKKRNKQRTENFMRRLRGKFRRFHVRRQHNVFVVVVVVFVDLRVVVTVLFSTTHHKAFRARRFGQGRRAKSKSQSIIRLIGCHRLLLSLSLSLCQKPTEMICALSLSLSLSLVTARAGIHKYSLSLSLSPCATLERDDSSPYEERFSYWWPVQRPLRDTNTTHTHTHTRTTTHNNIYVFVWSTKGVLRLLLRTQ